MEQSLRIAQLSGIKRFSFDYSKFGDDYMFSHFIPGESALDYFSSPVRFDGILFVLCLKGKFEVEINLQQIELCSNSLLCLGPDKIISSKQTDFNDFEAYFLFMSPQFLRDINIDMNVMNNIGRMASLKTSRQPVLLLSDEESQLLQKYMELLHYNTIKNSDELYIKNISRNIIASVIYQIFQFGEKYMPHERVEERPLSRRANYVQEFMRLMHENYRQERSVGFYADKLFISPKYLSLIIKEMTGRSAAEWIDECVILEAKNLLRYSGKNIQQVAYELNFTNQSSFGKYFKHLTGMSPSQFQKS
ncbi:MAG: helix-turn-helix transcriptional regulator [Muribaculaceae bacterium]|nr:helix-turn-helix transcriptional regulator [Muribaculaceae bacterium]